MKNNPFNEYTREYENWFKKNENLFRSELLALKEAVPKNKNGVEIGIGSGIFAEKLNIKFGIDPAENMLKIAKERNLSVTLGSAESLPYEDDSFDFAVFITSLCFIDKPLLALREAYRITKKNGNLITAFIDRESFLGKMILNRKNPGKFYEHAHFYSVKEIIEMTEKSNFVVEEIYQTLIDLETNEPEKPLKGFGKGSFIVIKSKKSE
ncbi:MAG: SAM-dependent methyltransferase [Candidatus Cloacimonadota bacterium]|nr:MAG: SAM-dependent methyltransferase [Candidatus Cloacimonadota bacterium]